MKSGRLQFREELRIILSELNIKTGLDVTFQSIFHELEMTLRPDREESLEDWLDLWFDWEVKTKLRENLALLGYDTPAQPKPGKYSGIILPILPEYKPKEERIAEQITYAKECPGIVIKGPLHLIGDGSSLNGTLEQWWSGEVYRVSTEEEWAKNGLSRGRHLVVAAQPFTGRALAALRNQLTSDDQYANVRLLGCGPTICSNPSLFQCLTAVVQQLKTELNNTRLGA